jgi:hypothetical protein
VAQLLGRPVAGAHAGPVVAGHLLLEAAHAGAGRGTRPFLACNNARNQARFPGYVG